MDTPRCQSQAGPGEGVLSRGWDGGTAGGVTLPGSTSRLLPFAPRWDRSCVVPGGGRSGRISPTTTGRAGKVKGDSPSERRMSPSADPGVGATVTRVAGAMDAGHLLATSPSLRSRDPPCIPPILFSPPGSGKEPRPRSPPHPAQDPALRWASCRGNPTTSFPRLAELRPERA